MGVSVFTTLKLKFRLVQTGGAVQQFNTVKQQLVRSNAQADYLRFAVDCQQSWRIGSLHISDDLFKGTRLVQRFFY